MFVSKQDNFSHNPLENTCILIGCIVNAIQTNNISLLLQYTYKSDIYSWASQVVLPTLFPLEDYRLAPLTKKDTKYLSNMYNYRLGPAMLRQYRVRPGLMQTNLF